MHTTRPVAARFSSALNFDPEFGGNVDPAALLMPDDPDARIGN
jgi:hypothetical protein